MLKKIIALLLTASMFFCLAACGNNEVVINNGNSETQTQSTTSQLSEEEQKQPAQTNNAYIETETHDYTMSQSLQGTEKPTNKQPTSNSSSKSTHRHVYSSATCTTPKKCSCGATSGKALGHNYADPTCTNPKTCTRCGQTSGNALGHNYASNKCSRCGKVDPASLPVALSKLTVIDSSSNYKFSNTGFTDTYGNTYNGVYMFGYNHSGESYAMYNLNEKYSYFSGSIVPAPALDSSAYVDYNFYLDDTLVYSKTKLDRTSPKIDFKINVKNASRLTIKVKTYFKPDIVGTGYLGMGAIVNAKLTK